jgi:SWI/SNF-related matrix-associated actin-dependent regulator of chromatin subfamily A3
MTGTPIQNRPTDLGSLLEYLQLYPFSNPKVFEAEVIKPWLKSNDRDITRLKKLIKYVSLCRTKQIIDLPQRKDEIHYLDLSPKEQEFYEMMKTRTVQKLDEALSFNPLAPGQYLNALEWLNELRLICNHGLMHSRKEPQKSSVTVSQDGPWNKVTATKAFEILVSNGGAICKLCQTNMAEGTGESAAIGVSKPSLSKCLTLICGSCIQNRLGGEKVPTCSCSPVCPKVEVSWAPETAVDHPGKQLPTMKEEQVSTKLNALLRSLQEHHATEKR